VVRSSAGRLGGQWITQDKIVAVTEVAAKLMAFDFKTQKWSDLVVGDLVNWAGFAGRQISHFYELTCKESHSFAGRREQTSAKCFTTDACRLGVGT